MFSAALPSLSRPRRGFALVPVNHYYFALCSLKYFVYSLKIALISDYSELQNTAYNSHFVEQYN